MFLIAASIVVLCACALTALAQDEPQPTRVQKFFISTQDGMPGQGMSLPKLPLPGGPADVTYQFISSEMSFDGNVVKNAPFSAEASTETTQVLADGNRITHKNTANLYRDAEGRTRREQTLAAIGPWTASGTPPQIISINDPLAGANYVLDPTTQTAHKMPSLVGKAGPGMGNTMGKTIIMAGPGPGMLTRSGAVGGMITAGSENGPVTMPLPPPPSAQGPSSAPVIAYRQMVSDTQKSDTPQTTESLGQQTIAGVMAQGTRTTMTIPAGQIGNELPIQVVSERWYSPDLMMTVMTKNTDPRFGTTVYQLENVKRDAPAAALFQVPPDYSVQDSPGPGAFFQQKIGK